MRSNDCCMVCSFFFSFLKDVQSRRQKNSLWGRKGEDVAEKYLRGKGLKIIERNFVNAKGRRVGEIDIIAKDGKILVFVEVKTRRRLTSFDLPPEISVEKRKIACMQRIVRRYLFERKHFQEVLYRFDVVSIFHDDSGVVSIKHIENIFL